MTPETHRQRFEGEREPRQLAPGRRGRPRIAATATAAAAATMALTGCQLEGMVDVGLSDVAVDLTLTHRVSTTDIPSDCLKVESGKLDVSRQMATRIGIAMKRLGWIKKRETNSSRGYYYLRPAGWGRGKSEDDEGGGNAPF